MRVPRSILPAALALTALVAAAPGVTSGDLVGWWLTEDGKTAVEITTCGESLCGEIVWLEGAAKADVNNRRQSLRDRDLHGLLVLDGFDVTPDEKGNFKGGEVYVPGDGKTYYRCTLTLDEEGRIKINGFADVKKRGKTVRSRFSRTIRWTRVTEESLISN